MSCKKNAHNVKDKELLKNESVKAKDQTSMRLLNDLPLLLDEVGE